MKKTKNMILADKIYSQIRKSDEVYYKKDVRKAILKTINIVRNSDNKTKRGKTSSSRITR